MENLDFGFDPIVNRSEVDESQQSPDYCLFVVLSVLLIDVHDRCIRVRSVVCSIFIFFIFFYILYFFIFYIFYIFLYFFIFYIFLYFIFFYILYFFEFLDHFSVAYCIIRKLL